MKSNFWNLVTFITSLYFLIVVNGSTANKGSDRYIDKKSISGIKYQKLDEVIVKPPGDSKSYSSIKLDNGLVAVIVSNPTSKNFSLSLDVNGVGWSLDPDDLPGLSNLVQKMLISGTSETGDVGEYQKFIKESSSTTSGAVTRDNTRFQLQASSDKFKEAVKYFSRIFVDFNASPNKVSHSVDVLESEFKEMVNDDEVRLKQMKLHYTNDEVEAPFDKFYQGNLLSLIIEPTNKGILVDKEVNNFFKENYVANRMRLVVHSPHTIEELEQLIINQFSGLPRGKDPLQMKFNNLFTDNYIKQVVTLEPKGLMSRLVFEFVVPNPYLTPSYSGVDYLVNLLNGKFGQSIFSKGEHYVHPVSIQANVPIFFDKEALLEISLFTREISAEDKYYIIGLFFDTIHFIRDKAVSEYIFTEQLMTRYMVNHRQEFTDIEVSNQLLDNIYHNIPIHKILHGRFYPTRFDKKLVLDMLDHIVPNKIRIFQVNSNEGYTGEIFSEDYFGLNYTNDKFPKATIKSIEEKLKDKYTEGAEESVFIQSHVNPFSLNKASVGPGGDTKPVNINREHSSPKMVESDSKGNKLWYQADANVPTINILLRNAQQIQSPKSSFQFRILFELIKDKLIPIFEDAASVKHKLSFQSNQPGYILNNSGPHEDIIVTTHLFIDRIKYLNIDPEVLEYHKEETKKIFKQHFLDPMYVKISNELVVGLVDNKWSFEEYAKSIDDISVDSMTEFKNQFISSSKIELLIGGPEITMDEAKSVFAYAKQIFNNLVPRTLIGTLDNMKYNFTELPMGQDWVYKTYRTKHNYLNSSIGFYLAINHPISLHPNHKEEYPNKLLLAYRKLTIFLFNSKQFDSFVNEKSPPSDNIEQNQNPLIDELDMYRDFGGLVLHKEVDQYPAKIEKDLETVINNFSQFILNSDAGFVHGAAELLSDKVKDEFIANPLKSYWESIVYKEEDFSTALELVEIVKRIKSESFLRFISDYLVKGGKYRSKLALHMSANILQDFNPNIDSNINSELSEDKSDPAEPKRKWKLNYMIDSE